MGQRLKGIRATLRRTILVKSANSTRQSKPQITTSSEPPSSQFPTSTVSQAESGAFFICGAKVESLPNALFSGASGKTLFVASDFQNSSSENLASSPNYSKVKKMLKSRKKICRKINFFQSASTMTLQNNPVSKKSSANVSSSNLLTPPTTTAARNNTKKRADTKLLICSVTICSIFISLFLPSVILNLIQVSSKMENLYLL
jgi:hypothetical protein